MEFILKFFEKFSKTTNPINYGAAFWYQIVHGDPLSNRSSETKESKFDDKRKLRNCEEIAESTTKEDVSILALDIANKLQKWDYDVIQRSRRYSTAITKETFCNDFGNKSEKKLSLYLDNNFWNIFDLLQQSEVKENNISSKNISQQFSKPNNDSVYHVLGPLMILIFLWSG